MKKRKILFIGLIVILGILGTVRVLICKYVPVTIVRIPQEIKFTNEYDPDAYLCLPAAYTSVDDTIEGSASYLIIESTYPMTLSDFAQEVSHYCYNAVNLDMGDYGYGWIGKSKHTRWAKYNRDKQTSWIVSAKQ